LDVRGVAALITGGSRGLGAALGRALARRGARVVLVARGEADLERTAAEIRSTGGEAHTVSADMGDKEAIYAISGAAAALVGPIDLLIHDASTLGPLPLRPLLDTTCEELERVLAVNLLGPFRLTRALLGSMVLRGRGLVLLVSSDAAVVPYAGWGAYGVSKAALDHLGRIWAEELRLSGVRVLNVDPGEMDTAMHAEAMPAADRSKLAAADTVAERIVGLIAASDAIESGTRVEATRFGTAP
jgi:NAD(P)-dependent dehydrogenase (short-subunit alcohol dehydrogenase family)